MWALFIRTLKDRKTVTLVYLLSVLGLLWMYISFFPSFQTESFDLEALLKNYPDSLMKAFNIDIKSFITIEGFISTEQFSFVWPLLMMFMNIGFAGSVLAGEIEKGTMTILLSQPIERWKIFLSKYLTGLLFLIIFALSSVYAVIPLCQAYNIDFISVANYNSGAIIALLFSWAVYSIAMLISSLSSDKGKAFFLSGALLVGMYVLNIVSNLKENLADLKYFSFFYYFNPTKALVYKEVDPWVYLVFGGVIILTSFCALLFFTRRDVN